jgi:hypothetical protein
MQVLRVPVLGALALIAVLSACGAPAATVRQTQAPATIARTIVQASPTSGQAATATSTSARVSTATAVVTAPASAIATQTETPAPAAATEAPAIAGQLAASQYQGLPQGVTPDGFPFLGKPDAPITLIDYSDFL